MNRQNNSLTNLPARLWREIMRLFSPQSLYPLIPAEGGLTLACPYIKKQQSYKLARPPLEGDYETVMYNIFMVKTKSLYPLFPPKADQRSHRRIV